MFQITVRRSPCAPFTGQTRLRSAWPSSTESIPFGDLRAVVGRREAAHVVAAERVAARHAEQRLGFAVPLEHGAVHAHADDRAARGVDERAEERLAALERFRLLEQLLVLELLRLRLRGALLLELALVGDVAENREARVGQLRRIAPDRARVHHEPAHLAAVAQHAEQLAVHRHARAQRDGGGQLVGRTRASRRR